MNNDSFPVRKNFVPIGYRAPDFQIRELTLYRYTTYPQNYRRKEYQDQMKEGKTGAYMISILKHAKKKLA